MIGTTSGRLIQDTVCCATVAWNFELFIDGKWTSEDAVGTIDVIDPATEDTIGSVPEASVATARRAIEAARNAFDNGPWP